jgi:predicted GNAT family N-acyltransferase
MSRLCDYFTHKDIKCRLIQKYDIPETVDLINKEYSYQDKYRNGTRTNKGHLSDLISRTEFYVFTDTKGIAGCVYIEFEQEGKVYFGLLTIASRLQKQGLGKNISKSVELYTKDTGNKELVLAYMHIEPWLKDYYSKMGFKENGDVWDWDGIKLINMSKRLS